MKKLFLVANWKANKDIAEMYSWFISFLNSDFITWLHEEEKKHDKTIIICPPFTVLSEIVIFLSSHSLKIPLFLGAQTISSFESGSYTGEVTGHMLEELVTYVIIGHSERRQMGETFEDIEKKVQLALSHNLIPIVCVQDIHTPVPEGVKIVAYEPVNAIGSGNPDSPEHANEVAMYFKESKNILYVLYGGSVTSKNVASFTRQEYINGVLVGGASLEPDAFSLIVKNA